ncbi:uncharacterized protein V2V93DRAFT_371373 [Kockiozyma suomiensis]|uniref:uncharacterized protein n=1 Tax=Kockiozyma suomiensis TaxID=1337062 RepID=UPI003343667A
MTADAVALVPTDLKVPKKTYLFGYPISHSLAPLSHNTLFADLGIPWTYELLESTNKNDLLEKLKSEDCVGCAVTMPHKITFIQEIDDVTEEGGEIGAINTVFKRKNPSTGKIELIGTNTDCIGVRDALLLNFPDILKDSTGKPSLVIGCGGAARSCVYALWKWFGVSKVYLINRDEDEALDLIEYLKKTSKGIVLQLVKTAEEAEALEAASVIISAVPDRRPVLPTEIVLDNIKKVFLEKPNKGYALEMCYHPNPATYFFKESKAMGWKVINGVEPMIYQGIAQQKLWTGLPGSAFNVKHVAEVLTKRISEI